MTQTANTMIKNWPDALRCGSGDIPGSVFMLHAATNTDGLLSWYAQVYPNEYRYVTFNADGTYNSRAGNNASSAGCENKPIEQLYHEHRAFNFLDLRTPDSYGITTMIKDWPDALRCGSGDIPGSVFMLHAATNTDGLLSWYAQVYPNEYRYVTFNADGTYNSRAGNNASSAGCENKPIEQLYHEDRAFDFVISKTYADTGVNTMIKNWPDALRCGSDDIPGSVFMLHAATNTDGLLSWYAQVYPNEYRYVTFNTDGTYNSRAGNNASSAGCENKSIEQLYHEDRAFNFVDYKHNFADYGHELVANEVAVYE